MMKMLAKKQKGVRKCEFCGKTIGNRSYEQHKESCESWPRTKTKYCNPMLENRINPNLSRFGRRRKLT